MELEQVNSIRLQPPQRLIELGVAAVFVRPSIFVIKNAF